MIFKTDKQTQDDLSILSRMRGRSVFDIYNDTKTRGGARLLEGMFGNPLADYDRITARLSRVKYFYDSGKGFDFDTLQLDAAEKYLEECDERNIVEAGDERKLQMKLQRLLKVDTGFQTIHSGVLALTGIFNTLRQVVEDAGIRRVFPEADRILGLLDDPEFAWIEKEKAARKLSFGKTARYDRVLRYAQRPKVMEILEFVFELDVYSSLARVAERNGYSFPRVLPPEDNVMEMRNVFHPQLENPTADNHLEIDSGSNVIFLTGANMAGKSTFMKSFAIAIYLAHMGFPVPAAAMTFSVRNGLYTSINLADNLNWGYSHFYSEVMRIKKVAQDMRKYRNMVIIFDELFRGTNVKDAYDGTIAVTQAFAAVKESIFVISTHILESAGELRQKCRNIRFVYLPTVMQGTVPVYTYKLTEGITEDRHGMVIIRNEGILEMLENTN